MKLVKISPKSISLSPKRLFGGKKKRGSGDSLSNSDPPSFGSGTSSSSSSTSDLKAGIGSVTPQSVLPGTSGDLSDFSAAAELGEAFRLMDGDNDGVISREALESLLSRLGGCDDGGLVAAMLSEVGGGGEIRVEALVSRVAGSVASAAEDSELREAFEFFDADRDGKISAEELLNFYAAIGDEQCTLEDCRRMIASVDSVGNGFVCFADFSRMMELQRL